jgi:CDP-4-dehydro-6-deoxyglucose reductase
MPCSAGPTQSDVTIEAREVAAWRDPGAKLPVRVAKLDKVADDVIVLSLQLPPTTACSTGRPVRGIPAARRQAPQLQHGQRPAQDEHMSLHIRHMPGGCSPTRSSLP